MILNTLTYIYLDPSPSVPGHRLSFMDYEEQQTLTSGWNCSKCTFRNADSRQKCDVCSHERDS